MNTLLKTTATIVFMLHFGGLWSQSFDSIKIVIPLIDTMVSMFSQSSVPMHLEYKDTFELYYVESRFTIEAQNHVGQWVNIESAYKSSEDEPGHIKAFPSKLFLNFFYFFLQDSTAFNACKTNGCNIAVRTSYYFQIGEHGPLMKRTSNLCMVYLPQPTLDELEPFYFIRDQFPEAVYEIPWLRLVAPTVSPVMESKIDGFGPSVIRDIMSYYLMEQRYRSLLESTGRKVTAEVKIALENEFGALRQSQNELVSWHTNLFFIMLYQL